MRKYEICALYVLANLCGFTVFISGQLSDGATTDDILQGPVGPKSHRETPTVLGIGKGERGDGGHPGFQGPKGDRGYPGFVGVKGDRGNDGLPGSTISCLPRFTSAPLIHSETSSTSSSTSSKATSHWLSDLSAVSPGSQAGRCVVCQATYPPVAVHSQSTEIPQCPQGWSGLWTGYSFVMKSTGYQLASTGSCLGTFKHNPLVQCTGGNCGGADSRGWWLAADVSKTPGIRAPTAKQDESTAASDNQENPVEPVSRCQVCTKSSA